MALDKPTLIADLSTAYDDTKVAAVDAETAKANFVNAIADAIERYVKSAQIVYTDGLVSATGGAVTGTFNGELE